MFSVSPPQKGEALDSKVDLKKDLKGTSETQYKNDFEKSLKAKLELKDKLAAKEKLQNLNTEKHKEVATHHQDKKKDEIESKADKKDKKSSGGIKKKMTTSNDDKMVSNGMASIESEVEIPDSKKELAEIEINIENISKPVGSEKNFKEALPFNADIKQVDSEARQLSNDALSKDLKTEGLQDQDLEAKLSQLELQLKHQFAEQVDAQQMQPNNPSESTPQIDNQNAFEQELKQQVDFQSENKSDTQSTIARSDLIQKMKSFEADKNLTADKAQAFEQAVLERLQKDNILAGVQSSNQKGFQSGDDSNQGLSKDTKSDLLKSDGSQHVGQTGQDFKSQFNPLGKHVEGLNSSAATSKLEDSDQKNIQHIMNQAQYLVKKGGGEMNVKMSPDGLGEVQLKVLLQDGKVNIEMQTQDKSVKKLIEDSLTELKSGLAAHHLNVAHVKIDNVTATNADNTAQNQSHFNQNQSESKQREFWKQFQDNLGNNQARRASYSDVAAIKPHSLSDRTVVPMDAVRTYGGTKGSTVNKVA